ncbi:hypothetical protein D3C74_370270 [compost metagenome]
MLTTSTSDAIPVHWGSRCEASIGAADVLPCPRNTSPRITSSAPGTRVPMMRPKLERPATVLVPCDDTHTPVQNSTTITIATYSPLLASEGLMTYANVLATYPRRLG